LIYYGRRIGPQLQISQWIKTYGRANLPWLVCKHACTYRGRPLEGQVVLRQNDMGQKRVLVLFKPDRVGAESRLRPPSLASPRLPEKTASLSRP